jgi:fatty-acyl-CoA synthase
MMMFDLLAKRARVTPRQPALEDLYTGARYNYAEFNARAARFAAAALQLWKLTPGDRVAWLGHSRAEFFVMLFGCAKAGLILVALNWRLTTSELKGLVSDCTPTALIFGAECAGSARALADTFPSIATKQTWKRSHRTLRHTPNVIPMHPGICSTPQARPGSPKA